jgi:small-conductance mechanosensitive channel
MSYLRKQWTPKEADEWTREDTIAVVISPLVYILLMVGTALAVLAMWQGFVILAAGVILMVVMIRIINPKLSSVSEAYEKKQKGYIEELERTIKWEE